MSPPGLSRVAVVWWCQAGAGGARGRIVYTAAVPKDPSQEGRAMGITALVEQGRGVLHVSGR